MRYPLLAFLLLVSPVLFAKSANELKAGQLPAPFTSILYARHEGSFYDNQAAGWEAIAKGECSTEDAWWNYYKTANYSNRFGSGSYDLDAILTAAEGQLDPDGFALNYLYFAHDQNPVTRWPHLLRAHDADPDNLEAATGLATYYTVNGRLKERDAILQRMHNNRAIPIGVMEYNHNQLMSVAPDGILITHGDSDTYPTWLLQAAYGIRPDVTVVNLPLLLGFPNYQELVKETLGLRALFAEEVPSIPKLFLALMQQNRPVFLAATGEYYMNELPADNLFVAGLTFQYSQTPVNNLGMIADIYENEWRLANLRQPLANDPGQAVADQLNQNYLPALLELHEYYLANPAPAFRENLQLIQSIAARAGRAEEVNIFLRGPAPDPQLASAQPGLKAKEIFKQLAYIPDGVVKYTDPEAEVSVNGFFMQETEVSNAAYQLFLEDLLRQRRFDLLDSVAVAPIDFKTLFSEGDMEGLEKSLNAGHPAYDNYPLVNISHRAAKLYALWLTQVYNQDTKRKDGRKVRFRLPSQVEFLYAFRGGKQLAPYPWGGPYYRNSKGCYLSNFNTGLEEKAEEDFPAGHKYTGTVKEEPPKEANQPAALSGKECPTGEDGGLFTVAVDAYFPNNFGLYNMAGNVAEMLEQPGQVMGGSWFDPSHNMQAGVVTQRRAPHPSVGFRLVMTYE